MSQSLSTRWGLPEEVKFCTRCVMSNQRPASSIEFKHNKDHLHRTMVFDEEGVCDACRYADTKLTIDWERREKELDATVRRPAEAERYRLETVAEGEKARVLAEAQADAEAIRLRGQADADAIKARGLAEAEAMQRKADAWKEYGQAAMIQQLFESLPQIANAVAQPLAKTDRITVISTGGDDSAGAGATKVTRDVTNTIAQLPALVESLTGIDLLGTLKRLPGLVTTEPSGPEMAPSGDGATGGATETNASEE